MFDWNDLRPFLAVARAGSTLAASRTLRISQPTVVRRVAALEAALGQTLFDRHASGYVLTAAGRALLGQAEDVETAAKALDEAARRQAQGFDQAVKISAFEIYGVTILAPILRDFHQAHPGLRVELDVSQEIRDLASGETDIALRSAVALTDHSLVCRRIADERWAFYASSDYARTRGLPSSLAELAEHSVIGDLSEDDWPEYEHWLREAGLRNTVGLRHGSATALLAAVRAGSGVGLLPCIVADLDPDLVPCLPPGPRTGHALWLVANRRRRNAVHVRLALEFIGQRLLQVARRSEARRVEVAQQGQ